MAAKTSQNTPSAPKKKANSFFINTSSPSKGEVEGPATPFDNWSFPQRDVLPQGFRYYFPKTKAPYSVDYTEYEIIVEDYALFKKLISENEDLQQVELFIGRIAAMKQTPPVPANHPDLKDFYYWHWVYQYHGHRFFKPKD